MRSRTDALSACVWGMCSRRGGRGPFLQMVKRRLSEAGGAVEEVGEKGRRAGFEVGGVRGSNGSLAAAGSAPQERTSVVAKARRARC